MAGVLKGATGAGAPIITIPVISAFYDVRLAVVLMVVPNFLSNIQQLYHFRKSILPLFATFSFALGGGGGAFLGTIFLANLSLDILSFGVGIIVIIFISFKFFVPTWKLEYKKSKNLFFPFGFFGGIFQGAAGILNDPDMSLMHSIFQNQWMSAAGYRIAGGTDEILRNIVAERVLGLPQDIRVDKNVPFNELADSR